MNKPIEFINVTSINPLISKVQIKVLYVDDRPNRNGTIITREVAREIANTLPGAPIVGHYVKEKDDFDEHNRIIEITSDGIEIKEDTFPYGFVDIGAKCWFAWYQDDDGVEREYLVTEGYVWNGQYPDVQRTLDHGNGQSMELDEGTLKGEWAKIDNSGMEFFIINEAIISKLCILGQGVEPCFEGANITKFSFNKDFNDSLYSMMRELANLLQQEGENKMDNIVQEPVVTTPVEENEPVVTEPVIEEPTAEPVVAPTYNLDEIPEYVELLNKYTELENRYNELDAKFTALNAEKETVDNQVSELVEFKKNIDHKEKEAMINSFYMLSDEDKADVVQNIDTYSLNDIEAKLSILCVRNKVNFSLDPAPAVVEPTVYNLDNGSEDEEVPEWVKAVEDTAAKM